MQSECEVQFWLLSFFHFSSQLFMIAEIFHVFVSTHTQIFSFGENWSKINFSAIFQASLTCTYICLVWGSGILS